MIVSSASAATIFDRASGTGNAANLDVFDDGSFMFNTDLGSATNLVTGRVFNGLKAIASGNSDRVFTSEARDLATVNVEFSEDVQLGYAQFQAEANIDGINTPAVSGFGLRTTRAFAAGESLSVTFTFPDAMGWGVTRLEGQPITNTLGRTAVTAHGQGQIIPKAGIDEAASSAFGGRIVTGGANDAVGISFVGADTFTIDLSTAAASSTDFFAEGFVPVFTEPGSVASQHDVDITTGNTAGGFTTFTNDSTDLNDSENGAGQFEAAVAYRDQPFGGDNIVLSAVTVRFTATDGWAAEQQIRFSIDGAPFVPVPEPSTSLLGLLASAALLRRKRA